MTSRRTLKAAEAIREVVSSAILLEISDPRVQDVTVTKVDVAPDMRSAKVHVSVMGDVRKQRLSLKGLESSAGYLQKLVSDRIDARYTPKLSFELDEGPKKSLEVARILKEVLPPGDGEPGGGTAENSGAETFEDDSLEADDSEDENSR